MSERKPTNEQKRAIETLDENVFVTAGAGTGKTFVLTEHYMQILRQSVASVSEILAVTFTDKAAREMRERIRELCRAEESAGEQQEFWSGVMHDLDGARIGTIHGMCSAILREYPLQAGCDPSFGVLDESAATILRAEAVETAIETLLERDDTDFAAVVNEYGLQSAMSILFDLIQDAERFARASEIMTALDDKALAAMWKERFERWREKAIYDCVAAPDVEAQIAILRTTPADVSDDKMEVVRLRVLNVVDEIRKGVNMEQRFKLADEILGVKLNGGSKKNWGRVEMLQQVKKAVGTVRERFKDIVGLLTEPESHPERTAALARSVWRIGSCAFDTFSALKVARGVLDFDDLQIKTRDLLRCDAGMRAALRARTRFVLVDEFQDVNPIQKEIVYMLAGMGQFAADNSAHLMVVGDAKQSIYRFRGADVTVFNNLRDELVAAGDSCVLSIDRNFRTASDGVALFNILFDRIMPRGADVEPYCAVSDTAVAHRPAASGGICAEMHVALFDGEEKISAQQRRDYEADMLAHRIREMVDGDECGYGDIAILFRVLAGRSKTLERALREYDIPYHVTAGSGFYGCAEIAEPISALRFVENPQDDYALLTVLRSTMMGLDDNTLFWIARCEGACLWKKLFAFDATDRLSPEQAQCFERAREILRSLTEAAADLDLSGILRKLLAETNYEAVLLASFMGEQKAANVRKLLDLARSFEQPGGLAAGDFVDYVDDLLSNETRESQAVAVGERDNVVRLMTVHKSKGLQFPVVILPDAAYAPGKNTHVPSCVADEQLGIIVKPPEDPAGKVDGVARGVWKEENRLREEAENKRVFYVATTRAEDRLMISATIDMKKQKETSDSPLAMIFNALDMDFTERCEDITLRSDANGIAPVIRANIFDAAGLTFHPPEHIHHKHSKSLAGVIAQACGEAEYPLLEPVAPDTRRKKRLTPSELAVCDYCARKFYLQSVLGRDERRDESSARAAHGDPAGIPANVFGTMAHEVFESLDPVALPEREQIAEFITARHSLDDEKVCTVVDKIAEFVAIFAETPLFAEIKKARWVRRELPFLLRLDSAFVQGTIDLVFEREDGTLCVIDYKSDRVDAGDMAAHAANYRAQMTAYAEAVRVATGRDEVSAALYFMRIGDFFEVKPDVNLLDKIVGRIREGHFERREGWPKCRCGYGEVCINDITEKGA